MAAKRVVFGVRPVEELCRARPRSVEALFVADGTRSKEVDQVIAVAKDRAIWIEYRPRSLVAELAGEGTHQGIVAVTGDYPYVEIADVLAAAKEAGEEPLILLLDSITDPQNLGALVRSAEVLGAHGVIIPDKHAAPVTGAAVKASAGATERMRIVRVANLLKAMDALREARITVWGASAGVGPTPAEANLRGATALVIGSEGRGLREAVARRCDGLVQIPQRGLVASLNASVAGAILLYEAARQRGAESAENRPAPG